jgi:hypothetical protein
MAPPFSSFMPDRTAVMGGLYENGSARFHSVYLCHPGNHMGFFRNGYTWTDSNRIFPFTPGITRSLKEQNVTALADLQGMHPWGGKPQESFRSI